ncbi:uncharacterized protein LOC119692028 [Plutella xylostella]|uniref:uncharacterized protein LOC119692028 n=1 Tax=Plutella xylostella TaxID=51655 RepID=UPI0020326DF1|nr:uncharacterized protein LOC119692028 [Plutella xylostella]
MKLFVFVLSVFTVLAVVLGQDLTTVGTKQDLTTEGTKQVVTTQGIPRRVRRKLDIRDHPERYRPQGNLCGPGQPCDKGYLNG